MNSLLKGHMSKDKKRVVVTGMGLVSCFGTDVETFHQNLIQGNSGVRNIESFDVSEWPTRFAAPVAPYEPGHYLDKKQARRVDPFIAYAAIAGKKALESAGFDLADLSSIQKERAGIVIGSGMGGMKYFEDGLDTIRNKGFKRLTPFFIPYIITNMAGALLGIDLGFTGPNYSISTACATANYSILHAANHIRSGEADLMICGGTEASINVSGVAGFVAIKALSERNDEPQRASRPWDRARDGFVMGEGCGVLVLESLEHALKRGAPIIAEYLGGAVNTDAYHMTDPRPDGSGVRDCVEIALKDSGISKDKINLINAHATSTPVGDLCEIRGLKEVFSSHANNIYICSTKSMIGHCLGAAAGLEAIATLKAIQTGMCHPTINCDDPEEELKAFQFSTTHAVKKNITAALSNSFGFGGHNSCLIFAPYQS
jgi:3-oxoacyl-[acyl-carrier-protein] synthase II